MVSCFTVTILVLLLSLVDQGSSSSSDSNSSDQYVSVAAWSTVTIPCPNYSDEDDLSSLVWVTPNSQVFVRRGPANSSSSSSSLNDFAGGEPYNSSCVTDATNSFFLSDSDRVLLSQNGSLVIESFGWVDRGIYACYVSGDNEGEEDKESRAHLYLESDYRWRIYLISLVYGFATAGAFLAIALLLKLIYYLLEMYGCCLCCCCCENRLPPRAKKVKVALDSIEAYKQQQLDKLKENYALQSDWIRQNCTTQMERVRDNYHGQVQNIKDIRLYGSTQIQSVRDQYDEQMQRIRTAAIGQLDRAQENYIGQRQRLRKFSAQNYLRMRATGKYTQRTLNKVIENLPPLYLDLSTCRGAGEGGQDHFDDDDVEAAAAAAAEEIDFGMEELEPFNPDRFHHHQMMMFHLRRQFYEDSSGGSIYFTPSGTPVRDVRDVSLPPPSSATDEDAEIAKRKSSSLKSTPTRDLAAAALAQEDLYKDVYFSQRRRQQQHKKSKSLSHFLPPKFGHLFGGAAVSGCNSGAAGEGSNVAEPNGNCCRGSEQTVRAIVERVTTSADYLDIVEQPPEMEEGEEVTETIGFRPVDSIRACKQSNGYIPADIAVTSADGGGDGREEEAEEEEEESSAVTKSLLLHEEKNAFKETEETNGGSSVPREMV